MQALDARPGAWTGQVLARVVEWQLEHPVGDKDACTAWLKAEFAAGRISVEAAPAATSSKRGKTGGSGSAPKKAKKAEGA